MRKTIDPYTRTSAHLCKPNIFPTNSKTHGKNVNTKSPHPMSRNTKKCRALNFSFLAISRANINIISPETIKNTSSKLTLEYFKNYILEYFKEKLIYTSFISLKLKFMKTLYPNI
jgi:hypothetical protein